MLSMTPWTLIAPVVAAAGVSAWGTFHPRSQLFGPVIRTAGDTCALTFDDGPNPAVTPRLLSLLDKHQVPATFFLLGKYVQAHPALAAEIAGRHHSIGNHTFSHESLVFHSPRHIIEELQRCEDAILEATGKKTVAVRPPFGFRGPQFRSAARAAGFSRIVMWSVNGHDWTPQPADRMRRRLEKVRRGDIVLLHDGDHRASNADRSHMLEALDYWLPRWKDTGFTFTAAQ